MLPQSLLKTFSIMSFEMGPEMTVFLSLRFHLQAYHSFEGRSVLLKTVTVMADTE